MTDQQKPAHPHINPWIIAISVMFSTFMEVLDTTVVNVSLPHISGSLSATIDESTWALTSYLVANAIILPLTGWLANQIGRKRLLMLSISGFTAASFLCGLAPSLKLLILFRIIQGLTGGALQPLSQAVLLEAFAPEDRGKAMGFWGLGIVVAPILGPVLGGWLTDSYSWRWVFYINIPIGIVSLIMTQLFIFDPPYIGKRSTRVDYWGIGMLTVGIAALQILLDKGQEEDWFESHAMLALAIVSGISLVAFIIRELVVDEPVIHLKVFRDRTYSTGVFLMTTLGFVLFGSLVLLPILLQTLFGYPSLQAGIALAPRGIGSFIAMPVIGIILARFGPRKLLPLGLAGGAFTLWWFGQLNLNAGYWDFFWPQFIQGISLALLFVPLTTITMDPIPREEMGNATSIFNLMRNLGGSTGIATVTTMLERRQQTLINRMGEGINLYNPGARTFLYQLRAGFLARGSDMTTATRRAYAAAFGLVEQQAAMLSFVQIFRFLAIVFLVMIPLVLIMRNPKHQRGPSSAGH
jgi:MFS transporter, DHA2 family, multidrug resistance protein